ncbi:MAG: dihydropteroate synthase [Bdellovibrionota bacterium]|nr:MAG: dihydropteroate synthase [Bdellovibrionota bacterium]
MSTIDVVGHIADFLCERVEQAVRRGVSPARIIVDPGMGRFVSNDPRYSFELLRDLPRFRAAGLSQPIMIGASRKGFLGGALGERDPFRSSQASALISMELRSFERTMLLWREAFSSFWERTQGASIEFENAVMGGWRRASTSIE